MNGLDAVYNSFVNNSCTARRRIHVIPKEVSYAFGMMRINEKKAVEFFLIINTFSIIKQTVPVWEGKS